MTIRYVFSYDPVPEATTMKVCFDFGTEPPVTADIPTDVSFAPPSVGGHVTVMLTPTEPCATVAIPKGAVVVTAHDAGTPQFSEDHVDGVP